MPATTSLNKNESTDSPSYPAVYTAGLAQARVDAALGFNPHIRHARSDERGYVRFALDAKALQAQLRVLHDVRAPDSPIRTAARFTVEAGRPGAQAA